MCTNEEDNGMKAWRQLKSQHCCPKRASTTRSPGGNCDASGGQQPAGLNWREQPPRKKAKQSGHGAAAPGLQQQEQEEQQHQQPAAGQSHKAVEKRRRDRMNQALSSLSKLIPATYMRQGQSRVEKAEIIELAAQHLLEITWQLRKCQTALSQDYNPVSQDACCIGKFYQGFREGSRAAMTFLTELEGFPTTDTLCCRLRAHLHALAQGHLPSQEELSRPVQAIGGSLEQQQFAEAPRGLCYLTDESPPRTTSEGEGDLSRNPKSSFKQRFRTEARSALTASPLAAAAKAAEDGDADGDEDLKGDEPLLPGFVLHESGAHYLPLVVPQWALGSEVSCSAGGPPDGVVMTERPGRAPLLHPISIPVNFRVTRFVNDAPMSRTRQSDAGGCGSNERSLQ